MLRLFRLVYIIVKRNAKFLLEVYVIIFFSHQVHRVLKFCGVQNKTSKCYALLTNRAIPQALSGALLGSL